MRKTFEELEKNVKDIDFHGFISNDINKGEVDVVVTMGFQVILH